MLQTVDCWQRWRGGENWRLSQENGMLFVVRHAFDEHCKCYLSAMLAPQTKYAFTCCVLVRLQNTVGWYVKMFQPATFSLASGDSQYIHTCVCLQPPAKTPPSVSCYTVNNTASEWSSNQKHSLWLVDRLTPNNHKRHSVSDLSWWSHFKTSQFKAGLQICWQLASEQKTKSLFYPHSRDT